MSLSALPVELLDSIVVSALSNGDFEAIALACKSTYGVAKDSIPQYNALKRKWVHISTNKKSPVKSILDVLRAVAENPLVARLITTLDLVDATDGDDDSIHANQQTHDYDATLLQLIEKSSQLERAGVDKSAWVMAMRIGSSATEEPSDDGWLIVRTVFLLTLLPNLKHLALPRIWSYTRTEHEDVDTVLTLLMREANSRPRRDTPLANLECLLPYQEIEYDPHPRGALRDVSIFLHMPRFTTLNVSNLIAVDDGYTGIPFAWEFADIPSCLTTLDLPGCCIDSTCVAELLKHTPCVTSFSYSHHTKWHGCEHDWDVGAFVEAIGQHTGKRLTRLAIKVNCLYGDVETGVTSLHDFETLHELELDVRLLNAPPTESGSRLGLKGTSSSDWNREALPAISDILPASLGLLRLNVKESKDLQVLRKLFTKAKYMVASMSFPKLEKVVVSSKLDIDWAIARHDDDAMDTSRQSLRRLLDDYGVDIE